MPQASIELDGVSKRFGAQSVLTALSFRVAPGEILGFLGPNGAGKTTTLRLLAGVIRADSGRIRVAGLDPQQDGDAIRRRTGVLTESGGLYPHMTGLDNLRFFAELYGVDEPGRPAHLLEEFGLGPHRDKKVGTYSTGMRKRLGLARALLHRPEILFLDEPTSGLDPEGIRMVLEQIAALGQSQGTTVILCSHVLQQLELVCHRYVFLEQGRTIEQGTLEELEERYSQEVVLQVETDLEPAGDRFAGYPVQRLGPGKLALTLPRRAAVPELLRQLTQAAAVYGAVLAGRDLQSLYFKIQEAVRHE